MGVSVEYTSGPLETSDQGIESDHCHNGGAALDSPGYVDRPNIEFYRAHPDDYIPPLGRSYDIPRFDDPEVLVRRINPDYADRSGTSNVNCADCARSFVRTWNGHAEEAAGRAVDLVPGEGLVTRGEPSELTEEWAGRRFTPLDEPRQLADTLRAGGHGSVAIVHSDFTTTDGRGGGHAYNVVNHEGSLKVVDAQTQLVAPWSDHSPHPALVGTEQRHVAMAWAPDGRPLW